jgi:hypothetical protein
MSCQMVVIRRSTVIPCSQSGVLDCLTLKDEDTTVFRNVDNFRRIIQDFKSLSVSLCKPQISYGNETGSFVKQKTLCSATTEYCGD